MLTVSFVDLDPISEINVEARARPPTVRTASLGRATALMPPESGS
jgi:hypothetical protein